MINLGRNHLESWDDIQYVLAVARTGSFLAASHRLGTNQSTIGRHVQRLEKRLGAKLFDRHSHGMRLTPTGTALIEKARNMETAVNEIERHLAGVDQKMTGLVRIAVPEGISTYWLTPVMLDFQMRHPQLCIELLGGTGYVDLLAREADVAIRLSVPKQDRYVASRVGRVRFSLFADPKYLDRFGKPSSIEEFRTHRVVDHGGYAVLEALADWQALVASCSQVVFRPNTTGAFVAAVRAGYGIGLFPDFYRIVAPDLVRLDLDLGLQSSLWLLSHAETNRNARVHAVFSYLAHRFRQDRRAWFA
jgi:DNA-binding transcriptional LysR family regulator